ncbi:MAG: succinylglutamate desuccinylase/aspartoacylase family protein [Alphaproteobacteria bacterium]
MALSGRVVDTHPVELDPPDIAPYRGNGPLPWVTTLQARNPGPHVAITAIVHGNELAGAIALDWLFRREPRPRRGRLSLAFANVAAYHRFDAADPTASRWVDEDLNRVWDAATLAAPRRSVELERARALRPWIDDVDLLLDLHSMQSPSPPLTLAGLHAKGVRLAEATAAPPVIVTDAGHASGRRLRDYGPFGQPGGDKAAILVECGQHWAQATAAVAIETAVRFLRAAGTVAPDWAADAVPIGAAGAPRRIEVTEAVTVRSRRFAFAADYRGLEVIPRRGTVIATDDGRPVVTPYDDCVLIMPSRRLWPGHTAVRLGRVVD